jgi:hypothetical protein
MPPLTGLAVAVLCNGHIEPETETGLRELERQGATVARFFGVSAIDKARSAVATQLLCDGFKEILWIDSDIVFGPGDAQRIRSHRKELVGGLYPKKRFGSVAVEVLGDVHLKMGAGGGLVAVKYLPAGFIYTRAELFERIRAFHKLPICNEEDEPCIPFFRPAVFEREGKSIYLTEDFSFCHYAAQAGAEILLDTQIRLFHKGGYLYSWEEAAGAGPKRNASLTLNVRGAKGK